MPDDAAIESALLKARRNAERRRRVAVLACVPAFAVLIVLVIVALKSQSQNPVMAVVFGVSAGISVWAITVFGLVWRLGLNKAECPRCSYSWASQGTVSAVTPRWAFCPGCGVQMTPHGANASDREH